MNTNKKSVIAFNTSREIPATIKQVFAAFTDPEHIVVPANEENLDGLTA